MEIEELKRDIVITSGIAAGFGHARPPIRILGAFAS
jgi:hypothetical protein